MKDLPHVDPVLVCTVATAPTAGLSRLRWSCRRVGIDLQVFGLGETWRGFGWRLKMVAQAYRAQRERYRYVLFLDGYDSIVQDPLPVILGKFLACRTPVLFSAERNCYPAEGPAPDRYPQAPTPYRYLNAGAYIGELDAVLAYLEGHGVLAIGDDRNDQAFLAECFVSSPAPITLDHRCTVFQNLFHANADLAVNPEQRIYNLVTGSSPSIFHGNGHANFRYVEGHVLRGRHWEMRALSAINRSPVRAMLWRAKNILYDPLREGFSEGRLPFRPDRRTGEG